MPRRNRQAQEAEAIVDVLADLPANETEEELETGSRLSWPWRIIGGAVIVMALLAGSFELAYWNKIYPGVSVNGVYVGGLSPHAAKERLAARIDEFNGHALAVKYGDTTLRIPIHDLGVQYETGKSLASAYQYGRRGNVWQRLREQARAGFTRPTQITRFTYGDTRLTPYIGNIIDDVTTPATNAGLTFNDSRTQVTPAIDGQRLDTGRLVKLIEDRLARTDSSAVTAPVYALAPVIGTEDLAETASQADKYIAGPVTIKYGDVTKTIERSIIVNWLSIQNQIKREFLVTHSVADLYVAPEPVVVRLNDAAVKAYVADLASRVDQAPQNAILTIDEGRASVFQPSRNGIKLEQGTAYSDIISALDKPEGDRTVSLNLVTSKPEIREESLNDLGIKELISEGFSSFPGSSSARITNVRTGAARFDGVLLKPDEVFSFGALLGEVGPQTGYQPELVILANHEEKQYGGGLCQVSSTAFRAALNAGLPITQRYNHSFAIPFYTAPYGVPGIDATIYYPQVDFKFKNDTGHYLLIQTVMQGTTLKFQFYGTKTKSGQVRGPQFVTGSMDHTKPSHTVFYRDVLDAEGKVTKTDTFHSYYKSSNDFPIRQEFN